MDKIQFRRDTLANWASANPILAEGEIGYVLDDPNRYKMGDGIKTWDQLPFRGFDGTLVQELGDSETVVMSQDAVTRELTELEQKQIQGGVYDVSSHNDGAVFESLSALLGSANLSTLIPTSVRHGGMSIRFIQGSVPDSDNKYVQYRLMANAWSTTISDWQGVDDVPIAGSDNLVKSSGIYDINVKIGETTTFEETTSGYSHKTFRFNFKRGVRYKLLNIGDYLQDKAYLSSSYEDPTKTHVQTINTNYILPNESIEFTCEVDDAVCITCWWPAHTKFSIEEVNSLNNRIQKNTDDIDELEPKVVALEEALEENKKETDAVSANGFNGGNYSGTSPEISAYYGAWCYVKPIYIKKGTKAIITVSNADSAIREDNKRLMIVRPDTTYFETNITFKQNVPTEYIFEDDVVSVGRYATLTVTGTFSINIQVIPFAERINILENNLDYKYPPYPIWGHEYMQAWYKKMYLSSSATTFKIVCAGDSITKNGNRDVYVKQLMVFRNWNENNINCVNMGVNGAQTESWIGSSESTPQYGYLDAQMAENPDLIVLGYGLNDGSNIQYPSLTWEEKAANFESRLREGLGRIRTNGTFASGPSYNKPASQLAIIITTPISISPNNISGNTNTADKWCKLIDPIIKRACRDFQCAYANFTAREYDHTWNKAWSISNDGIHPDSFIQKEMVSLLSDLICPLLYTFS